MNLDKLKSLLAAATPGPWRTEYYKDITHHTDEESDQYYIEPLFRGSNATDKDAQLIVAMRNCLPELLAIVEAADHFKRGIRQVDSIGTEYALHLALAALEKRLETL